MPLGAARFGLLGGVADLGKLEFIETKNVSASSSTIFTSIQESTYNVHFMTVNNFAPSVDGTALTCRFFENGVEESAAVYQYAAQYGIATGLFGEEKSTGIAQIPLTASAGNGTNEVGNGYSYFYNLGDSSKYSFHTYQSTVTRPAAAYIFAFGSGVLPQTSTVDQIKCFVTSGTYSADISLYGIAES